MINVPLQSRSGNGYGPMGRIGQNKANRTNWANKANRGDGNYAKKTQMREKGESSEPVARPSHGSRKALGLKKITFWGLL